MEKVSSSERFKTLMDERNLRQVDILNLVLILMKILKNPLFMRVFRLYL